jgi:flagellar protein FlaG
MEITPLQRPGPALSPAPVDAERVVGKQELIQAIKAVNAAELLGSNNELTFRVDRLTQRPVIRLVNKETGNVIRQIPPEYLLRMAKDTKTAKHDAR